MKRTVCLAGLAMMFSPTAGRVWAEDASWAGSKIAENAWVTPAVVTEPSGGSVPGAEDTRTATAVYGYGGYVVSNGAGDNKVETLDAAGKQVLWTVNSGGKRYDWLLTVTTAAGTGTGKGKVKIAKNEERTNGYATWSGAITVLSGTTGDITIQGARWVKRTRTWAAGDGKPKVVAVDSVCVTATEYMGTYGQQTGTDIKEVKKKYEVEGVEAGAFGGMTGVTSQVWDFTNTAWMKGKEVPVSLFKGSTVVQKVTLPGDVTGIGDSAFYGCVGLEGVGNWQDIVKHTVNDVSTFKRVGACAFTWSGLKWEKLADPSKLGQHDTSGVFGGIEEIGDSAFALIGEGVDSLIIDGWSLKKIGERAFAFKADGELVELGEGSIPYINGTVNSTPAAANLHKDPLFDGKAYLFGGRSWRSQEVALVGETGTGQPKVVDMRKMGEAPVLTTDAGWTGYQLDSDFPWEGTYEKDYLYYAKKKGDPYFLLLYDLTIEDYKPAYVPTRSNIDTKKYYGGRYGSTVKRMYLPAGLKNIMGLSPLGYGTAAYGGRYWEDDGDGATPYKSGKEGIGFRGGPYGVPSWYAYGAADTMLEYVELPESLESIGLDAFANCINVKFGVAKAGQKGTNVTGDWTSLKELKVISPLAFYGCEDFTEVKLPEKCIDFAKWTMGWQFAYSGLEKVTLAAGTQKISKQMFRDCKNLVKVNFNELTALGDIQANAFDGCEKLGSEVVDDGEDDTTLVYQRTWGMLKKRAFAGTGYRRLEIGGDDEPWRGGVEIDNTNIKADAEMPFYGCTNLKEVRLAKWWKVSGWVPNTSLTVVCSCPMNGKNYPFTVTLPGANGRRLLNGVGTGVTGKVVLMDYGDRSLNGTTHGGVGAFDIYEAQNGYKAKLWYEVRLRLDLMGGEIPDKLVYGHGKGLLGDRKLLVGIWDNWNEEWYNGPFDGDDHTGDHTAWTGLYAYGGTMSGAEGNGWKAGVLVSWVKKEDGEGNVYWLMDIGARPEANANKPWNHKISGDPQEANHWYIKSGELPMEMGMSVEAYEGGLPDVYICIPEF